MHSLLPLLALSSLLFSSPIFAQGPAGRTCNTVDPPVSHWSADIKLGPSYGSTPGFNTLAGLDAFGGFSVEYSFNPFSGAGLQALYSAQVASVDLVAYSSLNLSNLTAPFRTDFWRKTNFFARLGGGVRQTGFDQIGLGSGSSWKSALLAIAGLSSEYNLSDALALEMGGDLLYGPSRGALLTAGLRYKFNSLSLKHARNISMNDYRPQPSPIVIQRTVWVGNEAAVIRRIEALERSNDSILLSLQSTEDAIKDYKELLATQDAAKAATNSVNRSSAMFGISVPMPDAGQAPGVPTSIADSASVIAANVSVIATKNPDFSDRSAPLLKVANVVTGTMNPVEFLSGYSQLTPDSKLILNEMATILLSKDWITLTIIGNTDNQGNPSNNKILSLKRATIVRDYLVSKGLPIKKLKVRGNGGSNPIDSNKTPLGRRLNRRVDFILE